MGFKTMTSTILVECSTNWAMKPRQKKIRCEFNLYLLYEDAIESLFFTLNAVERELQLFQALSLCQSKQGLMKG